jgi:putative phosphoserine phosphatase / 1-acylglycerol-3-phosphate O-acyltransferase
MSVEVRGIDDLIEEVERSPEGPQVVAFFDFDGTLIDGYSAVAFFRDRLRNRGVNARQLLDAVVQTVNVEARGHDVDRLMNLGIGALSGWSIDDVRQMGDRVFRSSIAATIFPEARRLIDAHRRRGHTVVMASSAASFQVEAAAADLGIEEILCTRVDVVDGLLTGLVDGPILWGDNKAAAVRQFAADRDVDLSVCFAYGNGGEDVAYLETVGHPRPLNPDSDLVKAARDRSWPIARLSRPVRPTPTTVARTAAALAGVGAGLAVGLGLGLLNRDKRTAVDVTASVGSDLALAAAGIDMEVMGTEHLWSHRPAVFVFNHQSQLDVVVLAALLRQDFTGVAKKELQTDPFFAPLGWLGDVAFVDRADTEQAKRALAPAVEALRAGRSLAMAPEGTRSATPALGAFKKGAFHVAMQARVPMVPIVIRNAGELMPAHVPLVTSGTLQVAVLPPISTNKWQVDTLDKQVAKVRRMFVQTLADWPDARS